MPVPDRNISTATGCSVASATTITIDEDSGFDARDSKFCLVIKPTGSGTGTLTPTWADSTFTTDFQTAYDAYGAAISISLAAVSTVIISGIDLHKLKLTPSAISGVTAYSYSLTAVGT